MIDKDRFETLLKNPEGWILDFKAEQYILDNDGRKASFVKDILSMANTVRNETSYIVLGIKVEADGRKKRLGIKAHLDDACLQEISLDEIDRLYSEVRSRLIPVVFLIIQRRFGHNASEKERTIFLDSTLNDVECRRFVEVYSREVPERRAELEKIITMNRVRASKRHFISGYLLLAKTL